MNNPMRTFGKYQTSSKSVELELQGIVGELKIKLSVKLFCGSLQQGRTKRDWQGKIYIKELYDDKLKSL